MRTVRPKPVEEYTQLVVERNKFTLNFYNEVGGFMCRLLSCPTDLDLVLYIGLG